MGKLDKAKKEVRTATDNLFASTNQPSVVKEVNKTNDKIEELEKPENNNASKRNSVNKKIKNKRDARLNLDIDPDLLIKLKVYGARNHKILKSLAEEAIYKTYVDLK